MKNGDIADEFARERAESALRMAQSAWEGLGDMTREFSGVRTEIKVGFSTARRDIAAIRSELSKLRKLIAPGNPDLMSPPAPSSGKRLDENEEDYDPEITANGKHVRVDRETYYRQQAKQQDELNQLRADVEEFKKQKRDAELRAQGAEEERARVERQGVDDGKVWDRRLRNMKIIVGIVSAVGGIGAAIVHFLHL